MQQKTQKLNSYCPIVASLVLLLVFACPAIVKQFYVALPASASEINAENVIKYVNDARNEEGVPELVVSEKLTEVATAKVNDMVAHHYFAHTSPAGLTPWHWFELKGYDYKYAGENLAINFVTAEAQQSAWMKSPTHRKNIVNPNYNEIGVAVAAGEVNGATGIIAVQEFGSLAPGVAGDGKNFAPAKDKTLQDSVKFTPAVLSVGDNKASEENLKKVSEEIVGQKSDWSLQYGAGSAFWYILFGLIVLPFAIVHDP